MANTELVPELTNGEFDSFIKDELVMIDFFAEWCMPCTIMSPIIDDLGKEFEGKAKFGKVNVEENHKLAQKFGVTSIPTFLLFKDGKVIEKFSGAKDQEEIGEIVKKHL